MRAAFSVWNQRIAPVFDEASTFYLVDRQTGQIAVERFDPVQNQIPLQKALRLVALNVNTLVCGGISNQLHDMLVAYGIQVIPFVAGEVHDVIGMWLHHRFHSEDHLMPGCRRQGPYCFRGHFNHGSKEGFTMDGRNAGGKGRGQGGGRGRAAGRGVGGGRSGQRPGGMGGGMAAGPDGYCICSQCGHREVHQRGAPCFDRQCPKCGATMTRG